jgi:hypothetical protein
VGRCGSSPRTFPTHVVNPTNTHAKCKKHCVGCSQSSHTAMRRHSHVADPAANQGSHHRTGCTSS